MSWMPKRATSGARRHRLTSSRNLGVSGTATARRSSGDASSNVMSVPIASLNKGYSCELLPLANGPFLLSTRRVRSEPRRATTSPRPGREWMFKRNVAPRSEYAPCQGAPGTTGVQWCSSRNAARGKWIVSLVCTCAPSSATWTSDFASPHSRRWNATRRLTSASVILSSPSVPRVLTSVNETAARIERGNPASGSPALRAGAPYTQRQHARPSLRAKP